ncbi:MAG: LPS assembly lipoprotein LptE [Pseudomonadota bacterium]|nr:LPS assembly lipoprotein LptE [Pseudomonadota bacterium]
MRGNINLPDDIRTISLTSEFYSPLLISITDNLKNSNINVTDSKNKNLYRINILSESFKRRQLSINASGRVNEYEIIYDLSFEISPPNMKSDVETITLYRDYSFDENNIMGNSDREQQIRKEMVATSATLIYNRLNALANKPN